MKAIHAFALSACTAFAAVAAIVSSHNREVNEDGMTIRSEHELEDMNKVANKALGDAKFGMTRDSVDTYLSRFMLDTFRDSVNYLGSMEFDSVNPIYNSKERLFCVQVIGVQMDSVDFKGKAPWQIKALWRAMDMKYGKGIHLNANYEYKLDSLVSVRMPQLGRMKANDFLVHSWQQEGHVSGVVDSNYKAINLFVSRSKKFTSRSRNNSEVYCIILEFLVDHLRDGKQVLEEQERKAAEEIQKYI